jgi:hypothetical protein
VSGTDKKDLREAANYFYDACELWEDEDLDPNDTIEVLTRAFRSSDCDDYAAVLSRMTGWEITTMTWQVPGHGFGHHTLVKNPDGRLLDVGGWTDEQALRKAFGIKKSWIIKWQEGHISSPMYDDGDDAVELIETVIGNLPHMPYADPTFQSSLAPIKRNKDCAS